MHTRREQTEWISARTQGKLSWQMSTNWTMQIWTQHKNMSLKCNGTTRTKGVRPQWRDYQSAGMAMAGMIMVTWVGGKPGGGGKNMWTLWLEWVSAAQPCMLPAIMEMHCSCSLGGCPYFKLEARPIHLLQMGGALSKAPILCQPTTLLCSNPERGVKRQPGVDRGVKQTQAPAARRQQERKATSPHWRKKVISV